MSINWYPGHMHKAQKEAKQRLPEVDLVIEVLDARIPWSSTNPMLDEVAAYKGMKKPRLKLLNKADLADAAITEQWLQYYAEQEDTAVIVLSASQDMANKDNLQQQLLSQAKKLVPGRCSADKPLRAMIMGVPNVGKSTAINALKGRRVAKTGNEAAVTRTQQRIDLAGYVSLFDTPGMLWPKIENPATGYRLALIGSIKDTAFEYEDVAIFAVEFCLAHYRSEFLKFYKISENELVQIADRYGVSLSQLEEHAIFDLIELVGRSRGALVRGGRVDMGKISRQIVMDVRSHQFGPLSFETPAMKSVEWQQVIEQRELKTSKKAARKKGRS